jgi:dinuclear metal center YbgI/SA1388 family protein
MVSCKELTAYLDAYLQTSEMDDYGPMGLQVEGRPQVERIVTGVSAHMALFEAAVKQNADAIIVHHGLLWNRDSRVVSGLFRKRLSYLLQNDITLLAYHLCLDKHDELGNNVLAARALSLDQLQPLGEFGICGICTPLSVEELQQKVQSSFETDPLIFPLGPAMIERVGFCSGGGARELQAAIDAGCEAFITGEAAESTLHLATEAQIHFIAAGHHATEKLGVRALAEHLAEKFVVKATFIDIPNPV